MDDHHPAGGWACLHTHSSLYAPVTCVFIHRPSGGKCSQDQDGYRTGHFPDGPRMDRGAVLSNTGKYLGVECSSCFISLRSLLWHPTILFDSRGYSVLRLALLFFCYLPKWPPFAYLSCRSPSCCLGNTAIDRNGHIKRERVRRTRKENSEEHLSKYLCRGPADVYGHFFLLCSLVHTRGGVWSMFHTITTIFPPYNRYIITQSHLSKCSNSCSDFYLLCHTLNFWH